jgi:hypothetical protein
LFGKKSSYGMLVAVTAQLSKFGQLVLDSGEFKGQRIVYQLSFHVNFDGASQIISIFNGMPACKAGAKRKRNILSH